MSTPPRSRPIERLADALQECFNEAAENAANRAIKKIEPRLDRQDQTIRQMREHVDVRLDRQDQTVRQMREHMDARLDRQDQTLRMVWKQVKGNGKLPIDD